MAAAINIDGQKFGRLTVLGDSGIRKGKRIIINCRCECGNLFQVRKGDLLNGKTGSCGCLRRDVVVSRNIERRGIMADNWRGGKFKCNGYWYVYSPDHPNANAYGSGYVKQSRLVVESSINRILSRDENVHHINGKRDDDRIENLAVLDSVAHKTFHSKENTAYIIRDEKGRFRKNGGMKYADIYSGRNRTERNGKLRHSP